MKQLFLAFTALTPALACKKAAPPAGRLPSWLRAALTDFFSAESDPTRFVVKLSLLTAWLLLAAGCRVARFSEFRGEALLTDQATLAAGKQTAERYCGNCHLVPEPESMTQETAHYMLAYMGLMLGVDASRQLDAAENAHFRTRFEYLKKKGMIPAAAAISPAEWQTLRAWYLGLARYPFESLETAQEASLEALPLTDRGVTMLIKLSDGTFVVGGGVNGVLAFFDQKLRPLRSIRLDSPPVHLIEAGEGFYVLTLGSLLGALGENAASALWFIDRKSGKSHTLTRTLSRSAHFVMTDLDADGVEDFIVAGFGSVTGGGVIACLRRAQSCTQKILSQRNSVVRLALLEKGNGSARLLALSGGAREQLFMLEYENGIVRETTLADFAPHLGQVWLDTADLDGDGTREILVLSGDNADAGPYNEVKPDQGLRIYQLQNRTLIQKGFESLPGALSLALLNRAGKIWLAVARFYTDPQRKQDLTLLSEGKNLRFRRMHLALPSRPTLLLQADENTLLVGSGNLPLTTLYKGKPLTRQFTGPVLGKLQLPKN